MSKLSELDEIAELETTVLVAELAVVVAFTVFCMTPSVEFVTLPFRVITNPGDPQVLGVGGVVLVKLVSSPSWMGRSWVKS
jgi:hypothetical protein